MWEAQQPLDPRELPYRTTRLSSPWRIPRAALSGKEGHHFRVAGELRRPPRCAELILSHRSTKGCALREEGNVPKLLQGIAWRDFSMLGPVSAGHGSGSSQRFRSSRIFRMPVAGRR